jgi:8-oxo-dGTP pyrophosphatase MutT (NUDIX family)
MEQMDVRRPIPQASAVPFRHTSRGLEICLITSIKRGRWGFPKGIIDPGETYVEAALKEAREEAGLHGRILTPPVGSYAYAKWGTTLDVTVVLMQVTQCDDQWDESEVRRRRWVTPNGARQLVARPEVIPSLEAALQRLEGLDPPDAAP